MDLKRQNLFSYFLLGLAFVVYALFICNRIDLASTDVGRHLKNGELLMQGQWKVLYENLYAYSHPNYPFVNHHWLFGLILYLVYTFAGGFAGLVLLKIAVLLLTFCIFTRIAIKQTNVFGAALSAFVMAFILPDRPDVRPEIFSYLILACIYWLLLKDKQQKHWSLWLIPLLQIFWMNTHIFFVFGPTLVGIFMLCSWDDHGKLKRYLKLLVLTSAVCLINPHGLKGVLYPFYIYQNFGHEVAEAQSMWTLFSYIYNPHIIFFFWGFAIFSFCLLANWRKQTLLRALLTLWIVLLVLKESRFSALFGFFAIPLMSQNVLEMSINDLNKKLLLALILLFPLAYAWRYPTFVFRNEFGLGVNHGNLEAAQFFTKHNLKGPVLNNFNNGSYVTWFHYPQSTGIFIGGRPEAYPVEFFSEVYYALLRDERAWRHFLKKYDFAVIYMAKTSYEDVPGFIRRRVVDPQWGLVHYDDYNILLVRRDLYPELYEQRLQWRNVRYLAKQHMDSGDLRKMKRAAVLLGYFGLHKDSLGIWKHLREKKPKDPAINLNLARNYELLGRLAEAEEYAREAVRLGYSKMRHQIYLGQLMYRQNNPQGAYDVLKANRWRAPFNENIRKELSKLKKEAILE